MAGVRQSLVFHTDLLKFVDQQMSACVKGCRTPAVDGWWRRLALAGRRRTSLRGGNRGGLRRGGARAPLSRADLVAKAKKNIAYGGWDEARAERLIAFSETFGDGTGPLTLAEFAA